ncbi:hypothetical protein, unlikely [Trypanosoma brucei gambiense DAL972]|uniref:Uncharacterized protein n=1 Tax=Trypanosoma brucei gambiense (strain MHOM/CI/86/DAL972) TaxID=679716 RepID=C9ZSC8_TRYB9|nr:hypothetical protein, unlikely [Trypanosoma brucei gambiense DAL972]CBH12266.1 hypothetical protein, unlikely [Trypanosoma brucei gambiense DAL972]|eukprot:XP_011774547.1 hypothetical protein, unlikely [Trypanosoma brucei gambiense DAL972]
MHLHVREKGAVTVHHRLTKTRRNSPLNSIPFILPAAAIASSASSNPTSTTDSSFLAVVVVRLSKSVTSPNDEQIRSKEFSSKAGGKQRIQIRLDIISPLKRLIASKESLQVYSPGNFEHLSCSHCCLAFTRLRSSTSYRTAASKYSALLHN